MAWCRGYASAFAAGSREEALQLYKEHGGSNSHVADSSVSKTFSDLTEQFGPVNSVSLADSGCQITGIPCWVRPNVERQGQKGTEEILFNSPGHFVGPTRDSK